MKKFIIIAMLFAVVPFVSFAQTSGTTTTTAPSTVTPVTPGLLPGDFFYFLDRWGEALNLFLTFNQETKARLNLEYARERAAEIKQVLADPRRKVEDVADAKQNFDEHIAVAASTIKEEKDKGVDVTDLAKELDDELDASHEDIKDALSGHEHQASAAEAELRAKIAALPPGDPQLEGLTKALEAITKEKEDTQNEDSDLDHNVLGQQAVFEDIMGPQVSAEKHLEQVLRLREWIGKDGALPAAFSTTTEQLLKQAEEALKAGNFEAAKNFSEQAKHTIEKAREAQWEDADQNEGNVEGADKNDNEKSREDRPKDTQGTSTDGTHDSSD